MSIPTPEIAIVADEGVSQTGTARSGTPSKSLRHRFTLTL
jgi:hypothetical protein